MRTFTTYVERRKTVTAYRWDGTVEDAIHLLELVGAEGEIQRRMGQCHLIVAGKLIPPAFYVIPDSAFGGVRVLSPSDFHAEYEAL